MKVIMYHYIQNFDKKHPFFKFLDVKSFVKQLSYFEDKFGFLSKHEWENTIQSGDLKENKNKIILTFDDALACHYDIVYPILQEHGLWGIFYIPTSPYINKRMLDVHKIHLLCGAFKGTHLLKVLHTMAIGKYKSEQLEVFKGLTYRGQSNTDEVTEFKKICNYYLSSAHRGSVLDDVAKRLGYHFDLKKFYMTVDKIQELESSGNIIGAHTVSHPVMSKLNLEEQRAEIIDSFNHLNKMGIQNVKTYCHPYGEKHDFNEKTLEILAAKDAEYSFSFEGRDLEADDLRNHIQALPRYDCNSFPYGSVYKLPS